MSCLRLKGGFEITGLKDTPLNPPCKGGIDPIDLIGLIVPINPLNLGECIKEPSFFTEKLNAKKCHERLGIGVSGSLLLMI
jgi:hypothetical protein